MAYEKAKIVVSSLETPMQSQYAIKEQPLGTRRPFKTVCMGAGYAGLMMAIVADQKMRDPANEFVIYEKNHDMGGTWLENR